MRLQNPELVVSAAALLLLCPLGAAAGQAEEPGWLSRQVATLACWNIREREAALVNERTALQDDLAQQQAAFNHEVARRQSAFERRAAQRSLALARQTGNVEARESSVAARETAAAEREAELKRWAGSLSRWESQRRPWLAGAAALALAGVAAAGVSVHRVRPGRIRRIAARGRAHRRDARAYQRQASGQAAELAHAWRECASMRRALTTAHATAHEERQQAAAKIERAETKAQQAAAAARRVAEIEAEKKRQEYQARVAAVLEGGRLDRVALDRAQAECRRQATQIEQLSVALERAQAECRRQATRIEQLELEAAAAKSGSVGALRAWAFGMLGLDIGAEPEACRRGYRRRARETHPDHQQDRDKDEANQDFRRVRTAWEVLQSQAAS